MCKHIAAVFYGVGHRLSDAPELLFRLRGVDQADLVSESLEGDRAAQSLGIDHDSGLDVNELESIFGIKLVMTDPDDRQKPRKRARKRQAKKKKAARRKVTQRRRSN